MKKTLTNNLGLKIIALLFAIILWLIVVNLADPVETRTYRNIPVSLTHENVIKQKGLTYSILNNSGTTSVVVKGKRSLLRRIRTQDIKATADFRSMEVKTLVPIKVKINKYGSRLDSIDPQPNNVQVKLEEQDTVTMHVTPRTSGKPADGYAIGDMSVNSENIDIVGPTSVIKKISAVYARVNVTGMKTSGWKTAALVYQNSKNEQIDDTKLSSSEKSIKVYVQILKTGKIDVKIPSDIYVKDGYTIASTKVDPSTINVKGTKQVLSDNKNVTIQPALFNFVGDRTGKITETLDVTGSLPMGMSLADGQSGKVVVTLYVNKKGSRSMDISAGTVKIKNIEDGLSAGVDEKASVRLEFSGAEYNLKKLKDSDITMSVDLTTYTSPGTYEIPLKVAYPENVTLKKIPKIKVTIRS